MANVAIEIEYLVTRINPLTGELQSLVSFKECGGERVCLIQILPEKCALLDYLTHREERHEEHCENDVLIEISFMSPYELVRDLISNLGLSLNSLVITGQDLASTMISSHFVLYRGEEVINCNLQTVTDGIVVAIQNNIPILINEGMLLNQDDKLYQFIKKVHDEHMDNDPTSEKNEDYVLKLLKSLDDSKMQKH